MALTEEERRQRRMVSNRLSARRSRMKRQRNEEDLTAHATQLALNNEAMRATIRVVLQHCELVQQENRVRSADARHLYSELERRNSQLRILGQITEMPMDVPEIPAHLTQLYGGHPVPPPPLSPSLPPLSPYLPLLPPSLSLPLQPPPSLPLPLPLEIEMLFQPEPDQSDDVMDDAGSMPWL